MNVTRLRETIEAFSSRLKFKNEIEKNEIEIKTPTTLMIHFDRLLSMSCAEKLAGSGDWNY